MVWSLAQARVVISDLKADYIRPATSPSAPPRSTALSALDHPRMPVLAQQRSSNRLCVADALVQGGGHSMLDELGKAQTGLPAKPQHPTSPSTIGLPGRGHRPDSVLGRDARGHWPRGSSLGTPGGVMGARRDVE
jgi:hypothetical protein